MLTATSTKHIVGLPNVNARKVYIVPQQLPRDLDLRNIMDTGTKLLHVDWDLDYL